MDCLQSGTPSFLHSASILSPPRVSMVLKIKHLSHFSFCCSVQWNINQPDPVFFFQSSHVRASHLARTWMDSMARH